MYVIVSDCSLWVSNFSCVTRALILGLRGCGFSKHFKPKRRSQWPMGNGMEMDRLVACARLFTLLYLCGGFMAPNGQTTFFLKSLVSFERRLCQNASSSIAREFFVLPSLSQKEPMATTCGTINILGKRNAPSQVLSIPTS